jgi:hypothetical protein
VELDAVAATVTSEASTRAAADTALDTRVDALEAAPPAHTHPQSDVTGLVSDLAALDTRLDTLEAGGTGVASFNGRTGTVVPVAGDYAVADVTGLTAALAGKADDADVTAEAATRAADDAALDARVDALEAGVAGGATQAAHAVLAGPTTGSPAAPTFRALVAADVPTLAQSQVTNLVTDLAAKMALAAFATLTDGSTVTWATAGVGLPNATVTLGGNRTLSITGATSGQSGTLIVTQDGTGSRTLTLPSGSKVEGGALALSTAAGAIDVLAYTYDGTNYFWTIGKAFA